MVQTDTTMRERLFTMRMSAEEASRLDFVAKHYGLNAAGLIRMLLKREEDTLQHAAERVSDTKKKAATGSSANANLLRILEDPEWANDPDALLAAMHKAVTAGKSTKKGAKR